MSEDNRPIVAWDKLLSTSIGLLTIAGVLVGAIFWFARLEGGLTQVQASQLAQGARIDRIEESRSIGMQRLAKTEEAVGSMKDSLAQINAKLDRMLMRGH